MEIEKSRESNRLTKPLAKTESEIPFHMVATHARSVASDLFHLRVRGATTPDMAGILTPQALLFLEELEAKFGDRRRQLLGLRAERALRIERGQERPGFLRSDLQSECKTTAWHVATAPPDLEDRRVEITGPVEKKMMINALNSGAKVFIADLEDATSPTWENVVIGQKNLKNAVRRKLEFTTADGREYRLNEKVATLVVRPRGWHLEEKHLHFDGVPVSASLVDFGLYFFHNAQELLKRGSGPYFCLPKIESHLEARLWNDVFNFAQDRLGLARGTIRATVLIETILATFEMEEILFELRTHAAGLNAGRWDYLFSMIKKLGGSGEVILPDRSQLTMNVPFMRAYTKLLVATCHKHGAHAIGGRAAFIPSRKDAALNEASFAKVREDKEREATDCFDGTGVAHPDLVPLATEIFSAQLGPRANQKDQLKEEGFAVVAEDLLPAKIAGGRVTEAGVNENISVALAYLCSWLQGQGAVAINNLMEDAATAEMARAELWQWVKFEVKIDGGEPFTRTEFRRRLESERARFAGQAERCQVSVACDLLEKLVVSEEFPEFLTTAAYQKLQNQIF